jgi:hypothetical protein
MTDTDTDNFLLEMAEDTARGLGNKFREPDDDWPPFLIVRNRKNAVAVIVLEITAGAGGVTAEVLESILTDARAIEAVLTVSAWVVKRHPGEPPVLRPSQDPNREELLVFSYTSADEATLGSVPIVRHPSAPPSLGDMECWDGMDAGGVLLDAMRKAIT